MIPLLTSFISSYQYLSLLSPIQLLFLSFFLSFFLSLSVLRAMKGLYFLCVISSLSLTLIASGSIVSSLQVVYFYQPLSARYFSPFANTVVIERLGRDVNPRCKGFRLTIVFQNPSYARQTNSYNNLGLKSLAIYFEYLLNLTPMTLRSRKSQLPPYTYLITIVATY